MPSEQSGQRLRWQILIPEGDGGAVVDPLDVSFSGIVDQTHVVAHVLNFDPQIRLKVDWIGYVPAVAAKEPAVAVGST